jgi:hypothetical protein
MRLWELGESFGGSKGTTKFSIVFKSWKVARSYFTGLANPVEVEDADLIAVQSCTKSIFVRYENERQHIS